MYGWTFHQSHDQATVLFLVPQSVSSRDLDIRIGSDYIIASVRSQPAIIKARLYGRINTQSSTWRIGEKSKPQTKRRSRHVRRPGAHPLSSGPPASSVGASATRSPTGAPTSLGAFHATRKANENVASYTPHQERARNATASNAEGATLTFESPPPSNPSLAASTSSLRSGSSYEILGSTYPSGQHSLAQSTKANSWSSSSSDVGSSDSAAPVMVSSAVLSEPDSLSSHRSDPLQARTSPRRVRSVANVSAPDSSPDRSSPAMTQSVGSLGSHRSDPSDRPASRHYPMYYPNSRGASSPSGPPTEASGVADSEDFDADEAQPHPAVRLVTIHLDKIDSGIWPLLVVGPAPLQPGSLPSRILMIGELLGIANWYETTESLNAGQVRRVVQERSDQQQRRNAERELTKALGEALETVVDGENESTSILSSRTSVQSYFGGLSTTDDDRHNDELNFGPESTMVGPSTSTLSIVSTNSDESATVLGTTRTASLNASRAQSSDRSAPTQQSTSAPGRHASMEEDDDETELLQELAAEARFNMDPTTLSLIGLQVANAGIRPAVDMAGAVFSNDRGSVGLPEAFEYFARSWRQAEVALATERLVHDYLPFIPEFSLRETVSSKEYERSDSARQPKGADMAPNSSSDTFRPQSNLAAGLRIGTGRHTHAIPGGSSALRQRLVASLGGQKALARLYLSYARLHLPSSADKRSPLAFPHGQLNSPFVSGRTLAIQRGGALARKPSVTLASSPSSRASSVASSHNGAERSGASPSSRRKHSSRGPSPPLSSPGGGEHMANATTFSREAADALELLGVPSAAVESMPGPLHFLEEACLIDPGIRSQITETEWQEALAIEESEEQARQLEREGILQAEEMGSLAGESQGGDLVFDSDSEAAVMARRGRRRKRSGVGSRLTGGPEASKVSTTLLGFGWLFGSGANSGSGHASGRRSKRATGGQSGKTTERRHKRKAQGDSHRHKAARTGEFGKEAEGGVIALMSGAALLSVALAGSVAAVGWWRRASGALPTST